MERSGFKEAQEFFDSLPQSKTIQLTKEQMAKLHKHYGHAHWTGLMLVACAAAAFLVLLALPVTFDAAASFWAALLALAGAMFGALWLFSRARAGNEIEAGGVREYKAFLLDTESCSAVEIEYKSHRFGSTWKYALHIANRSTGKKVEFEVTGMRPHIALSFPRDPAVVVVFCGKSGYYVCPTNLFAKITESQLPA